MHCPFFLEAEEQHWANSSPQNREINTSINVPVLQPFLSGYNPENASYLVNGFEKGFKLGHVGEPCKNLVLALEMPLMVEEKLKKRG